MSLYEYFASELYQEYNTKVSDDCLEIYTCDNNNNNNNIGQGIKATTQLSAFVCLHKETPAIVVSPLKLSKNELEQWMCQTSPNFNTYILPQVQMVYFLIQQHPSKTADGAFDNLACDYIFPGKYEDDEQLAAALFVTLSELQQQMSWICPDPNDIEAAMMLLRLVYQWSIAIHSVFSDHRLGHVFSLGLMTYINHSCDPNCFIVCDTTDDWQIRLYSLREIRAGEEITIAYVPIAYRNRTQRQISIQITCHFQCLCYRCAMEESVHAETLESVIQSMELCKTDNDYIRSVAKKCAEQNALFRRSPTVEEQQTNGLLLLRYQWEYIKMLFGRSRVNSTAHWTLKHIEPYANACGEAITAIVLLMLEMDVENCIKVIKSLVLIHEMLHMFLQVTQPVLTIYTFAAIHFLLREMQRQQNNNNNDAITESLDVQHMNPVLTEFRWCVYLEGQFQQYYRGKFNIRILYAAVQMELQTNNETQYKRWSKLIQVFNLWKQAPSIFKQYHQMQSRN